MKVYISSRHVPIVSVSVKVSVVSAFFQVSVSVSAFYRVLVSVSAENGRYFADTLGFFSPKSLFYCGCNIYIFAYVFDIYYILERKISQNLTFVGLPPPLPLPLLGGGDKFPL